MEASLLPFCGLPIFLVPFQLPPGVVQGPWTRTGPRLRHRVTLSSFSQSQTLHCTGALTALLEVAQSTYVGLHLLEGPHHWMNVILCRTYLHWLHPVFCWIHLYHFLVILSWIFSKELQSDAVWVCGEIPLPPQSHHWICPFDFVAHHAETGTPCLMLACSQSSPSLLGAPGARNSASGSQQQGCLFL